MSPTMQRRLTPYAYIAPALLVAIAFSFVSMGLSFYASFHDYDAFVGASAFVGLDNYRTAFENEHVRIAFSNILMYGLIIVPSVMFLGMLAAMYVHNRWPLSSFARVCFFSPYVVSATVIGLIWVWMFDTQFGIVNHYLGYLGINNIPWLTSTSWSLGSTGKAPTTRCCRPPGRVKSMLPMPCPPRPAIRYS